MPYRHVLGYEHQPHAVGGPVPGSVGLPGRGRGPRGQRQAGAQERHHVGVPDVRHGLDLYGKHRIQGQGGGGSRGASSVLVRVRDGHAHARATHPDMHPNCTFHSTRWRSLTRTTYCPTKSRGVPTPHLLPHLPQEAGQLPCVPQPHHLGRHVAPAPRAAVRHAELALAQHGAQGHLRERYTNAPDSVYGILSYRIIACTASCWGPGTPAGSVQGYAPDRLYGILSQGESGRHGAWRWDVLGGSLPHWRC